MSNPNWNRWILASLADYFKGTANGLNLPVLVETLDQRTQAFMDVGDRAEVRITGPFMRELSKSYYQAYVDVNVLLTSRYDSRANAYDIVRYAGVFQAAMDQPITVWNYGSEPGDYVESDPTSQVYIGYLLPRFGQPERTMHFGQIDTVDHLRQTEVEARYLIELTN